MKFQYLLSIFAILSSQVLAGDNANHLSLGVGFAGQQSMVLPAGQELDTDVVPFYTLGVGQDMTLSPDWRLTTELSLEYLETNNLSSALLMDAKVKNVGLWASGAIKYTGFSGSVRPFVQVGVGQIYADYQDNHGRQQGWENATKVTAGLEFDVHKDMTFSVGFGSRDTGTLN